MRSQDTAEAAQLDAAVAALEAQRALLGDAVVDAGTAALRARRAALVGGSSGGAESVPEPSLRQVAILFVDVVGSTLLSQRLDPEAISTVIDDVLRRGTALVQAHHGRVLQYAGDSILAAFGTGEAREDDSERAVRCGLALLELGKACGAEVLAAHGFAGFDVRVGIHTGGVLLGAGVDADGSIRGIAVHVAARMEQTAPPGALRISHATYASVRGLFDVAVQPPLPVKGVEEPVQSYLVQRAKPRNFRLGIRGIEGVATRMIGRDDELEQLQLAFKRLYAQRRLAAISIVADAGIGKSRLLYEFEAWAETQPERFYVFRGRATPQTQGQPFGLLRDVLAWRLQIADDDTLAAARAKLEAGIVPLFAQDDGADLAQGHAHLLGHLIGIEWRDSPHLRSILDDPRQIRNRAFHVAAQLFRRVSSAGDGSPVVLALEDLHWADNESLDFLAYLVEVDRDLPLLVLACSRGTLFERRSSWCADDVHQRIELTALDRRASRDLAAELLQRLPEVPAALRELVTGAAEGNPFYMEELVRMLIDQRAIETGGHAGGTGWRVDAERLLLTHVPPTLTGVLQARLDSLAAAEKLALQQASVIGPVFWDRALVALDARAEAALPRLVQRELALPRASAADGLREYAFKHAVLHQVTYATVLKRTRLELHGKLAHWLAAQTGLRANDFLAAAAEHFEQAGDSANAAEFHARAAEHAQTRLAHEAVLKHAQHGLNLTGRQPEADSRVLRWRLLVAREATLEVLGERAPQRDDLQALQALADAMGDAQRRAFAAWRRGILAHRTDDYAAMESAAHAAVASASAAGDTELRLTAQRLLAAAQVCQGDLEGGAALAQATLAEARPLGLAKVMRQCLNCLVIVASLRHDHPESGLELNRQAIAVATGDRRSDAIARGNLGGAWADLGELDQGRQELEEALRLMRANGDRLAQCAPLTVLSVVALEQGDDARALALARTALQTAQAVQAPAWEMAALFRLGDAEFALGRHAEAEQAWRDARKRTVAVGHPWQHDAADGLARVALARGDVAAALREVQALLIQVGPGGPAAQHSSRAIELTCWRVLVAAGPAHEALAADTLRRAHDKLQADAARISDAALRRCFLHNLRANREIVAAWAAHAADGIAGRSG